MTPERPGTPVRFVGRIDGPLPPHGRDKAVEDDDPLELVGVRFPIGPDVDADREVTRCVVEDYALMGWGPERIRQLFRAEEYRGAHDIAARRGMELVEELIAEVFGPGGGAG